jgi:hypothetical protein
MSFSAARLKANPAQNTRVELPSFKVPELDNLHKAIYSLYRCTASSTESHLSVHEAAIVRVSLQEIEEGKSMRFKNADELMKQLESDND